MSRLIAPTVALMLLTSAGGALGAPPQPKPSPKVLQDAADAIVNSTLAQSDVQQGPAPTQQAAPKQADHDQGDDHASDVAIMKVCSHSNPSSQRSAICPRPNSPP
jgi:hypothetical protein